MTINYSLLLVKDLYDNTIHIHNIGAYPMKW